ncbi:MAG TPA: hypothetical protein VNM72_13150, partial [Blastocatellia bacterium]|nr:hypothetical protein [Blastocatellia bacterium]
APERLRRGIEWDEPSVLRLFKAHRFISRASRRCTSGYPLGGVCRRPDKNGGANRVGQRRDW